MKKRKTLKWLVVFVVVLLASMFFSRTVQTITTPKVQRIQATRGKLEESIPVSASLTFTQGEDIYLQNAKKLNLVVDESLAQQGYFVKEGDLLLRLSAPTYQEELDKIKAEYDKAVRALGEHIVTQVRTAQDSEHNQVYEAYFVALQAYYDERMKVEELAALAGYELPENEDSWGVAPVPEATPRPQAAATPTPVPLADMPADLKAPMQAAYDAKLASDNAYAELRRIYLGNSRVTRVGIATFDYVKKIYELRRAVDTQSQAMLKLVQLMDGMREIKAPHTGYLTAYALKKGDTIDGTKVLFTISKEGEIPTLKADISQVQKTIEKGTTVKIEKVSRDLNVTELEVGTGGKKYAIVQLNQDAITQLGGIGAILSNPVQISLVYKSPRTTTLLPASSVRTDADGSSFVYVVQQSWGGMLGNSQYTIKKQPINVLERSNRLVAISDELSYVQIADKEDRAVKDGQVVMDYVD